MSIVGILASSALNLLTPSAQKSNEDAEAGFSATWTRSQIGKSKRSAVGLHRLAAKRHSIRICRPVATSCCEPQHRNLARLCEAFHRPAIRKSDRGPSRLQFDSAVVPNPSGAKSGCNRSSSSSSRS